MMWTHRAQEVNARVEFVLLVSIWLRSHTPDLEG